MLLLGGGCQIIIGETIAPNTVYCWIIEPLQLISEAGVCMGCYLLLEDSWISTLLHASFSTKLDKENRFLPWVWPLWTRGRRIIIWTFQITKQCSYMMRALENRWWGWIEAHLDSPPPLSRYIFLLPSHLISSPVSCPPLKQGSAG